MEENRVYARRPSVQQKRKLIELVRKYPDIASGNISSANFKETRKVWFNITKECNALPGATKSWTQWRKCWHDWKGRMKVNSRKRKKRLQGKQRLIADQKVNDNVNGCFTEMEAIQLETNSNDGNCDLGSDFSDSPSEAQTPPRHKMYLRARKLTKIKNPDSKPKGIIQTCEFNCNMIALHEEKKVQIKEEYFKFKKDYLSKKLEVLKEQTEALKSIARALSEK